VRLVGQALDQAAGQARFADAGLAGDQHHLAFAVLGPGPALHQDAELVLAPDQRRETLALERIEAALGTTLPCDDRSLWGTFVDIAAWLRELWLERYADSFEANAIDHRCCRS
jgi:hypothetical protein